MKNFLYILMISSVQMVFAQVGIGTTSPTETLQVAGNAKLSGELTLENPGEFATNVGNYKRYLVVNTSGEVKRYRTGNVPGKAKYSPINIATYKLNNISSSGLTDFDTKIPADKYIVSIHSYEFADSNTIFNSLTPDDRVNGIVYRAFRSGGTWHLSFYGLDSELVELDGGTDYDLTLQVVIYRNKLLIADDHSTIIVNMGGNETGTAAKPTGY